MRTEAEMMDLILDVAKNDERIRAVRMEGSRANPAAPKDNYQDYDIIYYVAKGIARDELSYMMNWYIGTQHGFNLSTGKNGKYFKRFLSTELYAQYAATYSDSDYENIWASAFVMCDLFHALSLPVAEYFGFTYRQAEEDGIREYLNKVKAACTA